MNASVFDNLSLHNYQDDCFRNIKSIAKPQNLFNDLSSSTQDQALAIKAEMASKPSYQQTPIINRPNDEAQVFNAITYPFDHWMQNRYSDGRYGVWYGSDTLETTVHETMHHWKNDFLDAAKGFLQHDRPIISERRIYQVHCRAALLDFRKKVKAYPDLINPDDWQFGQTTGQRIHQEGHPGLINVSARCTGDIVAIFQSRVLSNPRDHCYLVYEYDPKTTKTAIRRGKSKSFMTLRQSLKATFG